MTKIEKNKLTMYHAVSAVLSAHQESINTLAPLVTAATAFKDVLQNIANRNQEFSDVLGVTAAKNSVVEDMTEKTYIISKALYALGRKNGQQEVMETCKITVSDFTRLRETEILQRCVQILTYAQTYTAELAAYTITPEMVTSLQQTIEQYRKQSDSKDSKLAGSKAARNVLFDLFTSADELLKKELDTLVELLKNSHSDFYSRYKAARTIKDLGGSQKSSAKVTDAVIVTNENVTESVTK